MSERTKALHQAASTLKKNPGRVDSLVKAAAMRIVPAGHYASGKAKEMAEAAIKKLKEPRGFAGASLSTKSSKFFKEASDKSKEGNPTAALTAIGAANGGALGYVARSDMANKRVKSHDARRSFAATKAGSPIEKNLADSAKRLRRMKPTVGRLARRAGVVGALTGAALGAASGMKKEAAAKHPARRSEHLMPKGAPIPAGAKDVSAKVVAARRARKAGIAGAVVGGLVGGASALAHRSKAHLEKKAAEKKKVSVGQAAVWGGTAVGLRRYLKDGKKVSQGLKTQAKYIQDKGGRISPMDVRMAIDSVKKPLARRAGKAALKGGLAGAALAVGVNKLTGSRLQKQAAAMIKRDGVKHRKGTPGSAAATMAGVGGGSLLAANFGSYKASKLEGLGVSRASILKGVPKQMALSGAVGYVYGRARSHFRKKRGEVDTSHADFKKLKAGK